MDIEALMEGEYEAIAAAGARMQPGCSSHKMLRVEWGFQSTEESSGSRLVHCRQGKGLVNPGREFTLPALPTHHQSLQHQWT
ncbi:hypothetical protein PVK06_007725 [Gossypium arboreum]|uniref:Uncharacterized protein n=1 Tax=Gossypium arboreum TaxID=29729 RepID=A0ABR0QI34_GOSAR|nr:hypothetical protein PVK06_007725 [Gossypium arboreum]